MVNSGLEGVVAATTRLSHLDGERGELVIAGYQVGELAAHATFEETTWLLWHGELPSSAQLESFRRALASARALAPATIALLRECARSNLAPMDALRAAMGTVSLTSEAPEGLVACVPTIVAAYSRFTKGMDPIAPRSDLGHAAGFLYLLNGEVPDPERVRGLETYLNTVVDHGLNASTFTARVITSTGSDLVSAVVGALGALKGPLHGGAPGPALDMVFEIGDASRAEPVLRAKIEAGEKLMGFGHRVYKVRDPRADVLAAAEFVGLGPLVNRPVASLGAAERRLVEVARAVVGHPRLVLLDEPAAGLPDEETRALGAVIRQIPDVTGALTILVDHDMDLVQAVCSHVAVLDFGHVIASGATGEVLDDPRVMAAYLGTEEVPV